MKKTTVAGLGIFAVAIAFAAKDPVIMTVNGEDVPKSEFEYLYNKNSQQQINPQTLDEYVEMFKLYKMKVADARAEGLDTMASFIKETEQYKHDLAAPYLADSVYLNQLVDEEYARMGEEVEATHIMFFKTRDNAQNKVLRMRADSVLQVLRNGGDFTDLAVKYSQDRGSNSRGGRMGWVLANRLPFAFEEVAWNLPEGQLSEVVESPMGYHILKGGKHRPARGQVQVAHILKLTQGMDESGKARVRHEVDSIYQIVKANPTIFFDLATNLSDDKGSARNGGRLNWFGAGEMVESFDSISFALAPGEISAPVESPYGYHIVYKLGQRGISPKGEVKPGLLQKISSPQDPRYQLMRDRQTAKLAKKFKASLTPKTLELMHRDLTNGALDSLYLANWTTMPNGDMPIATVKGKPVKARDFAKTLSARPDLKGEDAVKVLDEKLDDYYNSVLVEAEEDDLIQTEPDYRNLLKEYVDGSLLYEVSVRNVWDRAAQDQPGLQSYFERNRDNYKWTDPHVKGILVQAANDSVADLIKARKMQLGADTLVNTLRKEFAGKAQFDRVLVSKGTNANVDYLIFGGPEVAPSNSKYTVQFMIDPRILNEPEDVNDVKGLVTSDYQNEMQQKWEADLRRRYPVSVNEKVLRTVKK